MAGGYENMGASPLRSTGIQQQDADRDLNERVAFSEGTQIRPPAFAQDPSFGPGMAAQQVHAQLKHQDTPKIVMRDHNLQEDEEDEFWYGGSGPTPINR